MKPALWASALAMHLTCAQAQSVDAVKLSAPNVNLKTDGMPSIPARIVDKVAPCTEFRGHGFVDWHPKGQMMLVRHREDEAC